MEEKASRRHPVVRVLIAALLTFDVVFAIACLVGLIAYLVVR